MTYDFRGATNELFQPISHGMLAKYLNCSVAKIRQARLDPGAKAHRKAPDGWETEVAELAEWEGERLLRLARTLRRAKRK